MVHDDSPSRVGVDIGGTFTDLVAINDGEISVIKTPSTPSTPEDGVINSLTDLSGETDHELSRIEFLGHGATLTTNAILESEWATSALITTDGCRDVLEIGRQSRPDLYDLQVEKPQPLIEREHRFELSERVNEHGDVIDSIDDEEITRIAERIKKTDIESVAVCLLFSFENNSHENRVEKLLSEQLDTPVSLSSDVLPEIREYERTQTTAMNAVLQPVLGDYLDSLTDAINDLDIPADLRIMQSNGGIITPSKAREKAVNTCLSGPAAGIQGAVYIANQCDIDDIITIDMGGTSCDVSLVEGGSPVISTESKVGEYSISVPMIDIHTIGSGGGSIAWIDSGNTLRVGPQSAGANPGPICYGRDGTKPTVTDAHFLLGRIDPSKFSIDFDEKYNEVRDAIEGQIASPLGIDVDEAAQGILDVANANMERALRVVSVERGHDPREFGLVSYGGAGPLHACKLAAEMDIPKVIIPNSAGVLSAFGLVVSDLLYDFSTSRVRLLDHIDPNYLEETLDDFKSRGMKQLKEANVSDEHIHFERYFDLRYQGQSYSIRVEVPPGSIDEQTLEQIATQFHDLHDKRYGHSSFGEDIELVTIRLRARGEVEEVTIDSGSDAGSLSSALQGTREVTFDGTSHSTNVYDRTKLPSSSEFEGPAVIETNESTAVIYPNQRVNVDSNKNIIVEVNP